MQRLPVEHRSVVASAESGLTNTLLAVDTSVAVRPGQEGEPGPKDDLIIDTVLAEIDAVGYDAVELRTIAREARVSLATIYKSFPSRDVLLLAAVKRWMGEQVWSSMALPDRRTSSSDRLCAVMHAIFEPWLGNPKMLEAFVRATEQSGGYELQEQGQLATAPLIVACFDDDADPGDVTEILMIVRYMVSGLMADYAHGVLTAEEILPVLDMTVRRLTGHLGTVAR